MQSLNFIVQEVADFFENRNGIGFFFRVLSKFYQLIKKLIDVGQVEVSGQSQRAILIDT